MNGLLGKHIKSLRNAARLTQEQIADKIGVSRQKYARIENGTNNITLDILSKIAEVLGVGVADITKVLDEPVVIEYRAGGDISSKKIFDMIEVFYANKHMYDRLRQNESE